MEGYATVKIAHGMFVEPRNERNELVEPVKAPPQGQVTSCTGIQLITMQDVEAQGRCYLYINGTCYQLC